MVDGVSHPMGSHVAGIVCGIVRLAGWEIKLAGIRLAEPPPPLCGGDSAVDGGAGRAGSGGLHRGRRGGENGLRRQGNAEA